jgi:hypothetical protein
MAKQYSGAKKALFQIEVDQERFNRWYRDFWRTQSKYSSDELIKEALDLMEDVMGDTPVRFGRMRMAWGGLHKKMGKKPEYSRKPTATIPAQEGGYAEGEAKVHAFNVRRDLAYVEIYNPVEYGPFLEAGWSGRW